MQNYSELIKQLQEKAIVLGAGKPENYLFEKELLRAVRKAVKEHNTAFLKDVYPFAIRAASKEKNPSVFDPVSRRSRAIFLFTSLYLKYTRNRNPLMEDYGQELFFLLQERTAHYFAFTLRGLPLLTALMRAPVPSFGLVVANAFAEEYFLYGSITKATAAFKIFSELLDMAISIEDKTSILNLARLYENGIPGILEPDKEISLELKNLTQNLIVVAA